LRSFRRFFAVISPAFLSSAAFAGVVGSGTPSSCTEAALQSEVAHGGVVTFNCGAGPQTIAFGTTLVFVSSFPKVTIDGGDTITLDGTGITTGMIAVFGGNTALPDVTFKHITIANGNINTGLNAGGAIQNFGTLTLDTVTLKNNQSSGAGAIFQEPCTGCLTPSLNATHCLFQDNSTGSGAISIQGGNATIADSTFSGNTAASAGAIEVYGNANFAVDVTVERCTFTGNAATGGDGGAISVELLNPHSAVRIANDTFTGNTAKRKGAAIAVTAAPVTITNCTIAGNNADATVGAIYFGANTTAMNNTIIAGNSGGNCSFAAGSVFGGSHNLQFGDSTCSSAAVADPLLGPLADNGGPTRTMALGAGSPAIDAADTSIAPPTDQRGASRDDGNGDGVVAADIGAFEAPGGSGTPPPARHRAVKH